MARLIPDVDPRTINLKPERDVAVALVRDLPDNCLIYHSYCWLKRDEELRQQPLKEGEADFLILDPQFGLLDLEVKGGPISPAATTAKTATFASFRVVDGETSAIRLTRPEKTCTLWKRFWGSRNPVSGLVAVMAKR
ncbi:MAG: hypothetical protein R3C59_08625 [Planctomycetaceae bacterium]